MTAKALLFIGSVNRATGYFGSADGEGISSFSFDEETGQATRLGVFSGIDNPTFITLDRQRQLLFATSEVYGWNEGIVTAFRFDKTSGALGYLNKQATLGSITAHSGLFSSQYRAFKISALSRLRAALYRVFLMLV